MSVFTRFPTDKLIKGGSIPFRPMDNSTFTFFGGMWGGGGQDFDLSWFTRQIDILAELACNTVRIFGDLELQIAGTLNRTDYLTRWQAVIEYTRTKNIHVVVTGASVYELAGVAVDGVITEEALGLLEDLLLVTASYDNVIAFDPIQESSAWITSPQGQQNGFLHQPNITSAQLLAIQQTIYQRLKPQSFVPITFSGVQGSYTSASAFTAFQPLVDALPYMDYVDFHVYYPMGANDVDAAISFIGGREILIGEFGDSVLANSGLPGCPYENARAAMFRANVKGGLCWALADQSIDQSDCWGCADNNGDLRPSAAMLASFPEVKMANQVTVVVTGPTGVDFNKTYDLSGGDPPPDDSLQTVGPDIHGITWKRYADGHITWNGNDANGATNEDMFLVSGEIRVIGTNAITYKWDYTNHNWLPA